MWNLGAVGLEQMAYWPEVESEPAVAVEPALEVELGLEVVPVVEVAPEAEAAQLAVVEPAVEAAVKEPVAVADPVEPAEKVPVAVVEPVGPEEKAGLVVEVEERELAAVEENVGPEVEVDLQVQVVLEEMGLRCPVGDYSCASHFLCQRPRVLKGLCHVRLELRLCHGLVDGLGLFCLVQMVCRCCDHPECLCLSAAVIQDGRPWLYLVTP